MPLKLPSRPNLVRLKRLAKDLLAAIQRGEEQPLARLHSVFPSLAPQGAKLAHVHTVLARECGYPSWLALTAAVRKRSAKVTAKAARAAERTADAETLAQSWFELAEAGDLGRLWGAMTVGKRRGQAARTAMMRDTVRYGQLVETLIGGLGHPNAKLRFEYAHLLDTFGDARAVEPLRALITDPVPRVRGIAIHALTCHDCNEATCASDPELIATIADRLHHDESVKVRRHAAIALGEAGGPEVRATLEAVAAGASDPALRRAAEFGLRALAERLG